MYLTEAIVKCLVGGFSIIVAGSLVWAIEFLVRYVADNRTDYERDRTEPGRDESSLTQEEPLMRRHAGSA